MGGIMQYIQECSRITVKSVYICIDKDECAEGTDNCSAVAECLNYDGSFNCTCTKGYSGDGVHCKGI